MALGNAKTSLFLAVWRKIILLMPLIYILPHFFADKVFAVFLAEPALTSCISTGQMVCTRAMTERIVAGGFAHALMSRL